MAHAAALFSAAADDIWLVHGVATCPHMGGDHSSLVMLDRERIGREASQSAAVIDSQSVKTTESGGPQGYDASKKVLGRKRHAMVDTDGRPLVLQVHSASIQDGDGAIPLMKASHRSFPFVERAFADSTYAAERVADATSIVVEMVRKPADQIGFAVHPDHVPSRGVATALRMKWTRGLLKQSFW